jgi:hypothetical protein
MATLLKEARQHAAHLAAAAGEDDAQWACGLYRGIAHPNSVTR